MLLQRRFCLDHPNLCPFSYLSSRGFSVLLLHHPPDSHDPVRRRLLTVTAPFYLFSIRRDQGEVVPTSLCSSSVVRFQGNRFPERWPRKCHDRIGLPGSRDEKMAPQWHNTLITQPLPRTCTSHRVSLLFRLAKHLALGLSHLFPHFSGARFAQLCHARSSAPSVVFTELRLPRLTFVRVETAARQTKKYSSRQDIGTSWPATDSQASRCQA